ncbi:MAG: hypothetical protein HMLIMOIP_001469 [Candidatus Nitrosomirales archaeon]|jgi:hypothetical protein
MKVLIGLLSSLLLFPVSAAYSSHVSGHYGTLISLVPLKYDFNYGETVNIEGQIHAIPNGYPVLIKVINPKGGVCQFMQIDMSDKQNTSFEADPIVLKGKYCGIDGEMTVSADWGSATALQKFRLSNGLDSGLLSAGKVENLNARLVSDFYHKNNDYPILLDYEPGSQTVYIKNNTPLDANFVLVMATFDKDRVTQDVIVKQINLPAFQDKFERTPISPNISGYTPSGKAIPDSFMHIFAWTSLEDPTPLNEGIFVPY